MLPKSTPLKRSFKDEPPGFRERIVVVYAILVAANVSAWAWAIVAFAHQPILIGTALLAYSLGLRHALDADHIAAIDNVTRKLMQEGKRPVAVGFFFALGHSTVVVLASLAVALTAHALIDELAPYREIGAIIGTSASALFLFVIAIANLIVLSGVYRAFRRIRRGEKVPEEDIDAVLQQRGWLARLFRPLFRFVSKSWHLYPIGLLFALGFETASEISLFGLSAQASHEIGSWSIVVFPALFAAAMTLIDTTDGVLMVGAYGWAYRNPIRKLFYNLTITSVSVLVALVIGSIETLGLMADQLQLKGPFWIAIASLNDNFGALGYAIVALFVASWGVSIIVYRYKRYDRHEMPDWKKLALAAVAVKLAIGGRAMAADAVDGMPVKAPAVSAAPYDWAGFYVGGHVAYSLGRATSTLSDPGPTVFDNSFSSLYGGLQAGYNYLLPSRLLLGVETDITFPNFFEDGAIFTGGTAKGTTVTDQIDYIATLRGRFGYAFDRWLIYGTGGFAWSQARFAETPGIVNDEDRALFTRTGWALGLGAEVAIAPDWTARLEYLYDRLGTVVGVFPSGTGYQSAFDIQSLRLGLNRKLGASDTDTPVNMSSNPWPIASDSWNVHGQFTFVEQGYPSFHSPYEGANSLSGASQAKDTASATAYIGFRPWDGTDIYINPELTQGLGLSDTVGVAGFPNTEAQKAAFPMPRFNLARVYVQQTLGLGDDQETIEDGPNQIAGNEDISRITITAGKLAVTDFFDNNAYAHDGRTQFFNWQLYCCGSYDWTMDQISYTWGALAELNQKFWAFRVGYFLVPSVSNTDSFDTQFPGGEYIGEVELRYAPFSQPGKLRLMAWANQANMGSYAAALAEPVTTPNYPDITLTRTVRTNYGFAANLEQAITGDLGVFSRASWSPGLDEIIGWTDCDESVSAGAVLKGTFWGRPNDTIGVAGVIDGLSPEARAYFAAGGLGILIGDGALNYRPEKILETYYSYRLNTWSNLTFDYQFVDDPAYNADRGPVSIFSARYHAEF